MGTILLAVAAAAILIWFLIKPYVKKGFDIIDFTKKNIRKASAIGLIGAGALLALRGRIDIGMMLAAIGAWLLGHDSLASLVQRVSGAPKPVARIRSALVEVEIDPETGVREGLVLAGKFAGRRLSALTADEIAEFVSLAAESDPDALALLEPYLDRRLPGWREAIQAHLHARRDSRQGHAGQSGVMPFQEAYQVLGLEPGASREAVIAAHRALIQKLHPDKGGTAYLAAKLNAARDVLTSGAGDQHG